MLFGMVKQGKKTIYPHKLNYNNYSLFHFLLEKQRVNFLRFLEDY